MCVGRAGRPFRREMLPELGRRVPGALHGLEDLPRHHLLRNRAHVDADLRGDVAARELCIARACGLELKSSRSVHRIELCPISISCHCLHVGNGFGLWDG